LPSFETLGLKPSLLRMRVAFPAIVAPCGLLIYGARANQRGNEWPTCRV
jgi:hypothetical protein